MSVRERYNQIRASARLDDARANKIVAAARPHAEGLLRASSPDGARIQVTARRVLPGDARGGSLIPAWPIRQTEGSVVIEFVEDWGVMLASWCAVPGLAPSDLSAMTDLVRSGERVWVGIANDVLQLYVPDPPAGTYSMVRHHALML